MAHSIEEVRKSKGIAQKFIAEQLGFNVAYYNRIEKDKNYVPKLDVAYRLSEILDTPVSTLFPGEKIEN